MAYKTYKPLTSNLFPTPELPNVPQETPEKALAALAQILEGSGYGGAEPELPPVTKPTTTGVNFSGYTPVTVSPEATAQLTPGQVQNIQAEQPDKTVSFLTMLARIASLFSPGLWPVAAGAQSIERDIIGRKRGAEREAYARYLEGQKLGIERGKLAVEEGKLAAKLPEIDIELAAKTFLLRQGFGLDTPQSIAKAKTYFSSPQGKTEWDAYVEQRYPQSSMVPVQNPDGSVSYQLVSTRKGTALTTGLTKPKQLVPTNMIVDWSQGLNALDNLDVMSKLAEKVPSGLPGWATKKVLESSNIRSALSTVEQLSRKDVIPKDAYDYYAAWANFRIAAQSIIKGIPSNYDVISLLQTIGSLDMSPQQRRALLDYSKQLTVRLIEHQVAMQQAAGRSVPEEFTTILRNAGIDPDNVRARAYRDLPDKNKMLADILKTKTKPEESKGKPAEVKKGSAKKSAQEEADEFLKGLGM